jgi:glycolate oxidase iron-sulfur subunit
MARTLAASERKVLADEYDNLLACVRCGACLTSCPTYVLTANEAEGPRGRVAMVRALLEDGLDITPDFVAHQQSCLVCDACSAVCPAGVRMDPLQVTLRSVLARHAPQRSRLMLSLLLGNLGLLRAVIRALWLYQRSGLQWAARHLGVLKLLGLDQAERLLPPVSGVFLKAARQTFSAVAGGTTVVNDEPPTVLFFAGCIMSTALADIDRATIRVLQRSGCDVKVTAGQGCCGALNAHTGDREGARDMARRNIAAFEGEEQIIVNSAGCGAMLKDYGHLLAGDEAWAQRAAAFSRRVEDVTEFLADHPLPGMSIEPRTVAYQDACHLGHAQGIRQQPRALLRAVLGLELRELADPGLCCGSAGVYNLLHPKPARELQLRKVQSILASGASMVLTANPGCLLQLRAGLAKAGAKVEVRHIMELLDEASA